MPGAVITRKGQVTIPSEVVLRAQRGSILDLEGSVKPHHQPEDFSAVRQTVIGERAKRARQSRRAVSQSAAAKSSARRYCAISQSSR